MNRPTRISITLPKKKDGVMFSEISKLQIPTETTVGTSTVELSSRTCQMAYVSELKSGVKNKNHKSSSQ